MANMNVDIKKIHKIDFKNLRKQLKLDYEKDMKKVDEKYDNDVLTMFSNICLLLVYFLTKQQYKKNRGSNCFVGFTFYFVI